MTLNDLELVKDQILSKFCATLRFWGTTTAKRMQIEPLTSEKNVRQRLVYVNRTYSHGGATVGDNGSGCRAHTSALAWLSCQSHYHVTAKY